MSSVPTGEYLLIAGTDLDNDGYICDYGEACGGWPFLSDLSTFDLQSNRSNVDFPVGLVSTLSQNSNAGRLAQGFAIKRLDAE